MIYHDRSENIYLYTSLCLRVLFMSFGIYRYVLLFHFVQYAVYNIVSSYHTISQHLSSQLKSQPIVSSHCLSDLCTELCLFSKKEIKSAGTESVCFHDIFLYFFDREPFSSIQPFMFTCPEMWCCSKIILVWNIRFGSMHKKYWQLNQYCYSHQNFFFYAKSGHPRFTGKASHSCRSCHGVCGG